MPTKKFRPIPKLSAAQIVRLCAGIKIGSPDECWPWLRVKSIGGYGITSINRRNYYSHRVAYELIVGKVKRHLALDHICGNQACCNPSHLEPVTQAENSRRAKERRQKTNASKPVPGNPLKTYGPSSASILRDLSQKDLDRYWSKVKKGPDQECWPWLAAVNNRNYGVIDMWGRRGKVCLAHRLAYLGSSALAKEFGITINQVLTIAKGKQWKNKDTYFFKSEK